MSHSRFMSAVLVSGLAVPPLIFGVSPAYAQAHWKPEYQQPHALRAHRRMDRLTNHIQRDEVGVSRGVGGQ